MTASNVIGVALAAAAYILFRGRDRVLALLAFAAQPAARVTAEDEGGTVQDGPAASCYLQERRFQCDET